MTPALEDLARRACLARARAAKAFVKALLVLARAEAEHYAHEPLPLVRRRAKVETC